MHVKMLDLAIGTMPNYNRDESPKEALYLPACAQVEADSDSRDAESRVCAVRALGAVACKLCVIDGEAPRLRAQQLLPRVYDALLMAMEDYSTDSRCAAIRRSHI